MRQLVLSISGPLALLLTGCAAPYAIPAYQSGATPIATISSKAEIAGIGLGTFQSAPFDSSCRGLQRLAMPDGMTPGQYVRHALHIELGNAGALATGSPRVVLTGTLTRIESSSSTAITMGHWNIDMTLRSSNGAVLHGSQRYEFDAGFHYVEACRNVADAFPKAVQHLIGGMIADPALARLLQ